MRNLKRALSLALAAVMVLRLMIVGAGAADVYDDFTDKGEITHEEAVRTLVTLNVIDGKEDGSYYDPTGTLTRAEMAKIITYVMNGGVEPVLNIKATPTYSDIDNHWAEAYIEYCTSQGIIAGDGAGKFNPEGTLTGSQAAKMLLTAMGYNAIQSPLMIRSWTQNQVTGEVTESYTLAGTNNTAFDSLFKDRFDGTIYEGVLAATGEYDLSDDALLGAVAGDSANANGFVVNVARIDDQSLENNATQNYYFPYEDQDLTSFMGQTVKVLYDTNDEVVYGIYPVSGENTVVETYAAQVSYPSSQPNRVEIDGTTYSLESDIKYITGEAVGDQDDTYNDASAPRITANRVVFIDNDGNNRFDVALVTPINVAEVTFMSSTSVTLSLATTDPNLYQPASLTHQLEDIIYDEEMAQGDYVIVSLDYYSNDVKLELTDVASGTVAGVRGTPTIEQYQVDGTWYRVASGCTIPTTIKSGSGMDYVAVNGVLFDAELTSGAAGIEDLAVIYGMSYGATGTFDQNTLSAKIMLADGTKETVTVGALYDDVDGTAETLSNTNLSDEADYMGILLTYEVNSDGEYEFTKLTANNKAGFDSFDYDVNPGTSENNNRINNTVVSDDAAIILVTDNYDTNAGSVKSVEASAARLITGREYKSIDNTSNAKFEAATSSVVVGEDSSGFTRVLAAVVIATADAYADGEWTLDIASGSNYAYLTADAYTETRDGTRYTVYPVWNGTENLTLYYDSTSASDLFDMRSIIAYDVVSGDEISNVEEVGVRGAITANSSDRISIVDEGNVGTGSEYELANDVLVVNINDENHRGEEGNAIQNARQIGSTGVYVPNTYYVVSGGEVQALFVDTNKNELNGAEIPSALTLTESPVDEADGEGVNAVTNDIGVPTTTSLGVANVTNVQTYVESLFSNEASVVINSNDTTCISADVTGPTGVTETFDLVAAYTAPTIGASGGSNTATNDQIKTSIDTVATAANGIASYTVWDAATNGSEIDLSQSGSQTSSVYVQFVALNGETIGTRVEATIAA